MEQAYEDAGWRPDDVNLIECHGTGTPSATRRDQQPASSLEGRPREGSRLCPIGPSIERRHLLAAAGTAGLVKTLLAMQHRTLPPSASSTERRPAAHSTAAPFQVQMVSASWPPRAPSMPRRARELLRFGGIRPSAHRGVAERPAATQCQGSAALCSTGRIRSRIVGDGCAIRVRQLGFATSNGSSSP